MIQTATDLKSDEIIDLNVKGVIMPVKKSLLTSVPGTALEAMFSGRHELDKKSYIPYVKRDPEIFKYIIQYLENDQKVPFVENYNQRTLLD